MTIAPLSQEATGAPRDAPARRVSAEGAPAPVRGGGAAEFRKTTGNASAKALSRTDVPNTFGTSVEKVRPGSGLGRADLVEMGRLQGVGYERVGLSQRIKACGTIPLVNGKVAVGISESGGVSCSGLARCGRRWCHECWGKVTKHRGEEVAACAEWAVKAGHQVVLVTLTAAHTTNETLAAAGGDVHEAVIRQNVTELFDRIGSAWRYATSGRGGKKLKNSWVGFARGFELTIDGLFARQITGSHGHIHVAIFVQGSANLDEVETLMWEQWKAGCRRSDLRVSRQGFDFKVVDTSDSKAVKTVASYLTKGEKLTPAALGHELTSSATKYAESRGRTSPEGFLRSVGALSPEECEGPVFRRGMAMWRSIESACRNRKWLTWSRDLRKLAGLGEELTDEEIATSEAPLAGDTVAVVRWSEIKGERLEEIKSHIGAFKKSRRFVSLLVMLDSYGIEYELIPAANWGDLMREHMRARRDIPRRAPI